MQVLGVVPTSHHAMRLPNVRVGTAEFSGEPPLGHLTKFSYSLTERSFRGIFTRDQGKKTELGGYEGLLELSRKVVQARRPLHQSAAVCQVLPSTLVSGAPEKEANNVQKKFVNGLQDLQSQNVLLSENKSSNSRTLYLVDIHPLCYEGKRPRPTAILKWMRLLFNQVTREEPVIAVMDGEKGNDYRRQLVPGYKAKRNKYKPLPGLRGPYYKGDEMDLREAFPKIQTFLAQCNVPVVKVEDAEADDVVATLMHQAVSKGMRVVVASPDMDFRQLLSENVNMLLPLPEFGRWSFYTLEHYITQNTCDPSLDLGLRCIMGDSSDDVPGLPDLAPGFGRKTALKLMKKHGSLENLLASAKTRTVGRPYIQEALTKHADTLYRNLEVLKLRRDLDITLKEEWCRRRDRISEVQAFLRLEKNLMLETES